MHDQISTWPGIPAFVLTRLKQKRNKRLHHHRPDESPLCLLYVYPRVRSKSLELDTLARDQDEIPGDHQKTQKVSILILYNLIWTGIEKQILIGLFCVCLLFRHKNQRESFKSFSFIFDMEGWWWLLFFVAYTISMRLQFNAGHR